MKTVLITGIDKGIGKALAEKFLAEGYFVVGTIFRETDLSHKNLTIYNLDLSNPESINECSQKVGNIDILINNAGVMADEEETSVVTDKLRKTLEVNLIGTIDFTERLLNNLNEGGHVVNISSSAGSLDNVGKTSHKPQHYPSYKISKSALNMYTKTLALKYKDDFIVSSVHPGWVKTDMGGEEADLTPREAAENIYKIAISNPETGQFWFEGEKFPW